MLVSTVSSTVFCSIKAKALKKRKEKEKERKKKKRIEMKRKRTFVELEPAQPSRPLCMKRGWKISLASRC